MLLNFDVTLAEAGPDTPAPHSEMYATVKVWGDVWLQLERSGRWSDLGNIVAQDKLRDRTGVEGVAGGMPLPEDLQ